MEASMSRRAALAISAAALAGSAGSLVSVAKATAPEADAVLIDAWAKYRAAMAYNDALSEKIAPLWEATFAALPPHMEKEEFLSLTEEQRVAYEKRRMQDWQDACDTTGLTAAGEEQDHFLETVVHPLDRTIAETPATTMKGASIKAAFLMEHALEKSILRTEKVSDLDLGDAYLRLFIEQLAALSAEKV